MEHLLSASLVLFTSALFSFLLFHLTLQLNYDFFTRTLYLGWALLQLILSLSLYRLSGKPLKKFFESLQIYSEIRKKDRELDSINSLFLAGLFLLTVTPFLYTYLSTHGYSIHYAILSLFMGGLAVAGALVGYVSR